MRRLSGTVGSAFVIRTTMDAVRDSEALIAQAQRRLDSRREKESGSKVYRHVEQMRESLRRLQRALDASGPYERRRRAR